MNCVKAQDKLLQTLKSLSLQQCLTVCRHYENLKLHIQQIHPSDKYVEFLKKTSPKEETGTQARISNEAQYLNTIKCNTT